MLFGEKNDRHDQYRQVGGTSRQKAAGEWGDSKSEHLLGLLPAVGKTGDTVKKYLQEMGLVSLLSRRARLRSPK